MKQVAAVAAVAKQTGHSVIYKSPHPAEAKQNAEQNAQHNRDMERIERMHLRGLRNRSER